jgi:hypothetical protein
MGEAALTSVWRIRACLRQGGLSRNKVSVGEPADGSPPKKNRRLEFFVELQSPPLFLAYTTLLFTPLWAYTLSRSLSHTGVSSPIFQPSFYGTLAGAILEPQCSP